MKDSFIPYKQALTLKGLGFDEQCLALYDLDGEITIEFINWKNAINRKNNYLISAPFYQQAFKWFREKYSYSYYIKEATKNKYRFYIKKFDEKFYNSEILSYEEAELECLKKLIEIVKNK